MNKLEDMQSIINKIDEGGKGIKVFGEDILSQYWDLIHAMEDKKDELLILCKAKKQLMEDIEYKGGYTIIPMTNELKKDGWYFGAEKILADGVLKRVVLWNDGYMDLCHMIDGDNAIEVEKNYSDYISDATSYIREETEIYINL